MKMMLYVMSVYMHNIHVTCVCFLVCIYDMNVSSVSFQIQLVALETLYNCMQHLVSCHGAYSFPLP